jgi:hypothetical protein
MATWGTYHSTVPTVAVGIGIIWLDDTGIARLEVFTARRLDLDQGILGARRTVGTACAVRGRIGGCLSRVGHCDGRRIEMFVGIIVLVKRP